VFCTDLATYDTFNRVYSTYFHGHYPARAFVGINALLFGVRYELMGVAAGQARDCIPAAGASAHEITCRDFTLEQSRS
jgi:hypothetical protein